MKQSRPLAIVASLCLTTSMPFAPVPVMAAVPVSTAAPEPPLTRGPHATPPSGAEFARLVALHDHQPVDEAAGDVTATVVAYTIHVKLATDEEWRAYYGATNAFTRANSALESADDAMYAEFAVDLYWYQSVNWDSSPDSGNVDACDLLDDLRASHSPGQSDILVGFAKNYSVNYAGCAEIGGDEAEVAWNSSSFNRWAATQHEVSHLFYLPDRYPDPNNLHTMDVMESAFQGVDFWCGSFPSGTADWVTFYQQRGKFE